MDDVHKVQNIPELFHETSLVLNVGMDLLQGFHKLSLAVNIIARYIIHGGNVAKKFLWGNGKTNERALIYALPRRAVIYERATYSTHASLAPTYIIPVLPSEKT